MGTLMKAKLLQKRARAHPVFRTAEEAIVWIEKLKEQSPGMVSVSHFLPYEDEPQVKDDFNHLDPQTQSDLIWEAEVEGVNQASLVATQDSITKRTLFLFLRNPYIPSESEESPVIFLFSGCNYIMDGHHRVIASLLLGTTPVEGKVISGRAIADSNFGYGEEDDSEDEE